MTCHCNQGHPALFLFCRPRISITNTAITNYVYFCVCVCVCLIVDGNGSQLLSSSLPTGAPFQPTGSLPDLSFSQQPPRLTPGNGGAGGGNCNSGGAPQPAQGLNFQYTPSMMRKPVPAPLVMNPNAQAGAGGIYSPTNMSPVRLPVSFFSLCPFIVARVALYAIVTISVNFLSPSFCFTAFHAQSIITLLFISTVTLFVCWRYQWSRCKLWSNTSCTISQTFLLFHYIWY